MKRFSKKTQFAHPGYQSRMPTSPFASKRFLCASVVALAGLLQAPSVFAMRFVDANAGNDVGTCDNTNAPCKSIAYAIANSNLTGDIINLQSSTGAPVIFEESGIQIPINLTIRGVSASVSVIDAGGTDRIFELMGGDLQLERVTLRNGNAQPSGGLGGAILVNNGELSIDRSILQRNVASQGGAIASTNTGGSIRINRSRLERNRSTGRGGALHCASCNGISIRRSNLSRNLAGVQGGAVFIQQSALQIHSSRIRQNVGDAGGGIFANIAPTLIRDSDISGNEADAGDGGAVWSNGILRIERSTLSNNVARDNGGAALLTANGTLRTTNSTFSGNTAISGGALQIQANSQSQPANNRVINSTFVDNVASGTGQAHHISGVLSSFELSNSILSLSPALQATGPACNEPVLTGAANLTADTSCENGSSLFSFGAVSGLNTTLASNGGIGRTHAIAPTSNAVDAAFQSYCVDAVSGNLLTVDQRRQSRPVDGNQDAVPACDIGAYELQ